MKWLLIPAIALAGIAYFVYTRNRKKRLIQKYGVNIGTKIFNKAITPGMTYEMLLDAFGDPEFKMETTKNGVKVYSYFYGMSERGGHVYYNQEVKISDGKIVSWSENNQVK